MWKVLMVVVTGCLAVAAANVLRLKSSKGVPFKDCGSKHGAIMSLDVEPCGEGTICKFKRGSNVTVTLGFKSGEVIATATTSVHGIIAGVPVKFPLPDPNACHDMKCPVKNGGDATYKNVIAVQQQYPKLKLVVKWEIVDKVGDDVICFEVPAEITD